MVFWSSLCGCLCFVAQAAANAAPEPREDVPAPAAPVATGAGTPRPPREDVPAPEAPVATGAGTPPPTPRSARPRSPPDDGTPDPKRLAGAGNPRASDFLMDALSDLLVRRLQSQPRQSAADAPSGADSATGDALSSAPSSWKHDLRRTSSPFTVEPVADADLVRVLDRIKSLLHRRLGMHSALQSLTAIENQLSELPESVAPETVFELGHAVHRSLQLSLGSGGASSMLAWLKFASTPDLRAIGDGLARVVQTGVTDRDVSGISSDFDTGSQAFPRPSPETESTVKADPILTGLPSSKPVGAGHAGTSVRIGMSLSLSGHLQPHDQSWQVELGSRRARLALRRLSDSWGTDRAKHVLAVRVPGSARCPVRGDSSSVTGQSQHLIVRGLPFRQFMVVVEHIRRRCRDDAAALLAQLSAARQSSRSAAASDAASAQAELRAVAGTQAMLDLLVQRSSDASLVGDSRAHQLFHRALCLTLEQFVDRSAGLCVLRAADWESCVVAARSLVSSALALYTPAELSQALLTCADCQREGHAEGRPSTVTRGRRGKRKSKSKRSSSSSSQKPADN